MFPATVTSPHVFRFPRWEEDVWLNMEIKEKSTNFHFSFFCLRIFCFREIKSQKAGRLFGLNFRKSQNQRHMVEDLLRKAGGLDSEFKNSLQVRLRRGKGM